MPTQWVVNNELYYISIIINYKVLSNTMTTINDKVISRNTCRSQKMLVGII